MCAYSMIMDHFHNKWKGLGSQEPSYPFVSPVPFPPWPLPPLAPKITQAEIDEFHALLERAREYDIRMHQPNCELESKKEKIRALAKELNVEISLP